MTNRTRLGILYPALVALCLPTACGDGGAGPSKPRPAGPSADGGGSGGGSGSGGSGGGSGGGTGAAGSGRERRRRAARCPRSGWCPGRAGRRAGRGSDRVRDRAGDGRGRAPPPAPACLRRWTLPSASPASWKRTCTISRAINLFYLSTHRGFIAFDVADSDKAAGARAHLPFGHPRGAVRFGEDPLRGGAQRRPGHPAGGRDRAGATPLFPAGRHRRHGCPQSQGRQDRGHRRHRARGPLPQGRRFPLPGVRSPGSVAGLGPLLRRPVPGPGRPAARAGLDPLLRPA